MNILEEVFHVCEELLNLPKFNNYKSYISSRVSNMEDFRFGYFPSSNNLDLLLSKINKDDLLNSKLIYHSSTDSHINYTYPFISFFENHQLIMPYYDTYGEIISLVGRCIDSEEVRKSKNIDKYKNTIFDKSNYLFNLHLAKKHILEENEVLIVEGQFDAISAYCSGVKNVVALGSSSMSVFQLSLLLRYTKNITLLLDNDDGGKKGRERINKYKDYANIRNLFLPEYIKDVDEFFMKYGLDEDLFKKLL
jgi:DNA primase catalytic core